MTFGERITNLRKEYGYKTRKDFCKVLGIPETTLRNYEKDDREPGHTFLIQISRIFGVSVDYLLGLSSERSAAVPSSPLPVFSDEIPGVYSRDDQEQLSSAEAEIIAEYRRLSPGAQEPFRSLVDTATQLSRDGIVRVLGYAEGLLQESRSHAKEKSRLIRMPAR